jgi:TonB family protein
MSQINDPRGAGFRAALPADLQDLDRELSAIRVEERSSFGPELEAELTRAWRARQAGRLEGPRPWARVLLAAGLAGLMIASLAVPSARASVWDVVRTILEEVAPSLLPAPTQPEPPETQVPEPGLLPAGTSTGMLLTPREVSDEAVAEDPDDSFTPVREITFPRILGAPEAERIIESHYPMALQRAGVGGTVRLMFWVDSLGVPENIQVREGSGFRSLDYAAMMAARDLLFQPATRDNVPVGTWVEFVIHFVPGSVSEMMNPDPPGSGGGRP